MKKEYWFEGKVKIPEEKKAEVNDLILNVLKVFGIRKTTEIQLAGKQLTVVEEAKPNDKGMVYFDYSLFEKKQYEVSSYDTNTCEFECNDLGKIEYKLVMIMMMTILEAYSETQCYLMHGEEICYVSIYAEMIEYMTGKIITFPNRADLWSMYVFFKLNAKHEHIVLSEFFSKAPNNYCKIDYEGMYPCVIANGGNQKIMIQDPYECDKAEIGGIGSVSRMQCAYSTFKRIVLNHELVIIEDFLKDLLKSELCTRKEMAKADDEFGTIAEISLYEHPASIVAAYAFARNEDVLELWMQLGVRGYRDYAEEDSWDRVSPKNNVFLKVTSRDNEDEFLEEWDERELCLSSGLQEHMSRWKELYSNTKAEAIEFGDVECHVHKIVSKMYETWKCHYVDKRVIDMILEHINEDSFQRFLILWEKLVNQAHLCFPELTERQVEEWVQKGYWDSQSAKWISGYTSLLLNSKHRAEILGF